MVSHQSTRIGKVIPFVILVAYVFWSATPLLAQSTTATGSIQGTLTDPSGAVVEGAKITITNKDTAQALKVASSSAGAYNSGALVPGNYSVRAEATGFKTVEEGVIVKVGVVSGINFSDVYKRQGSSCARSRKFRPFTGKFSICSLFKTP